MGVNKFYQPLGSFPYQQAPIRVELIRNVNIHALHILVEAQVDVAGGTGTGTALAEGVQRLARMLRVKHDGTDVVAINGRWAYQLYLRTALDVEAATNLANAAVQSDTQISAWLTIPFEHPWAANPMETVWPGTTPIGQELALYIEPETAAASGANSTAGTGALISGGDQTGVTFDSCTFTVVQEYSTGVYAPLYTPRYIVRNTEQITVARTDLPFSLNGVPRFDMVVMRNVYGSNALAQDGINKLTFWAGGGAVRYYDQVSFRLLQMLERKGFPAVRHDTAGRTGVLAQQFADKGRLGGIVNPAELSDPRFIFDVDAPTSSPGQIELLFCELHKLPGVTRDKF